MLSKDRPSNIFQKKKVWESMVWFNSRQNLLQSFKFCFRKFLPNKTHTTHCVLVTRFTLGLLKNCKSNRIWIWEVTTAVGTHDKNIRTIARLVYGIIWRVILYNLPRSIGLESARQEEARTPQNDVEIHSWGRTCKSWFYTEKKSASTD